MRLILKVLKLMSVRMGLKLKLSKDWVQILKKLFMTSVDLNLDVDVDLSEVEALVGLIQVVDVDLVEKDVGVVVDLIRVSCGVL